MTITNDPNTPLIHQQHDHPLNQKSKCRSNKQSPNRAGIPMPRGARAGSANGSSDQIAMTQIDLFACVRREF